MMGGRIVAIILSAVIFFLQGGDCWAMFAKDKQAQDCCRKGHCSRTNPDPCCQISAKTDMAKDQVKERAPVPVLTAMAFVPIFVQPVSDKLAGWATHRTGFTSQPGERGNFSLPLLV